jgi:HEXXH motif-containing protein
VTALRTSFSHLDACPPWSSDLPAFLADLGRRDCLPPSVTARREYGTAQMLLNCCDAPVAVVARIPFSPAGADYLQVELLSKDVQEFFAGLNLRFATAESILRTEVLQILRSAIDRFGNCEPGIAASIRSLIWSAHILEAESDDFDASYSTPDIPFSVFVSVPRLQAKDSALRVIEAVIHETMHLQLSLVERAVSLVAEDGTSPHAFSPWKGETRPVGGILHAIYVFRVIDWFWWKTLEQSHDSIVNAFARSRRLCIAEEIAQVQGFDKHPGLTNAGRELVQALLER